AGEKEGKRARQSLWICVTRQSLLTRGNEGRGKRREKSEAEPLDMRYQAEPVNEENEEINTKSRI
ncbi:hypothetical protein, partial [Microcoleus sp. D2_18a_B4]|uniref:hypothetical protein n=1 Tax=Microcoleus sp. D2_18a_B4 TaxID=3055329 RepID=UPI002FD29693